MKIYLIGRGNVAVNLHEAFLKQQMDVPMLSSREGLHDIPQDGDAYIYAVRDGALEEVISRVHTPQRALHLHTSGTIPVSVFGTDKPHAGVLYPFQTFSKQKPIEDFSSVPVFIEAQGIDDISAVYSLALMLTKHVYETSQRDRERLHLAGVLVNNFPNCLYGMAARILQGTHIPFEALLPIIDETAAKVHRLSPREAQTGPARRGDDAVMQHHLQLLDNPAEKEIYRLLSQYITEQYKNPDL